MDGQPNQMCSKTSSDGQGIKETMGCNSVGTALPVILELGGGGSKIIPSYTRSSRSCLRNKQRRRKQSQRKPGFWRSNEARRDRGGGEDGR